MKILTISTSDLEGGAAKAAYRLHKGLLNTGTDASMLVLSKRSDDFTVVKNGGVLNETLNRLHLINKPERWISHYYRKGELIPFSPSFLSVKGVIPKIKSINPDLVHLHWIHAGFMNLNTLLKIDKPIIWTLHDMWAFTGGCHYDDGCGKYTKCCGACPILQSNKENDLSRWVYKKKQKTYPRLNNLTIVALSQWLYQCAKSSSLFENVKVVNLPNGIDTQLFKPLDRSFARESLNLPQNKQLILFGALDATSDHRKGFHLLQAALNKLSNANSDRIEVVVFGASTPKNPVSLGFKVHYTGKIHDETTLALLYAATDVMVVPSMQENLSNTIMESLACGTPVVAFDIGGNADMIDHQSNGFLASPFDSGQLANGINWLLSDAARWGIMSQNARKKIEKHFALQYVSEQYLTLYKNTVNAYNHSATSKLV